MHASRHRVGIAAGRAGYPFVALLALGLALGGCSSAGVKAQPPALQGADPVAWAGAFCGGLGDVIAGAAAVAKSPPSPQGQKDGLLQFADVAQQAFANTAKKLTQLGPPRITDGPQVQTTAVTFFTTTAGTISGQRAKLAALDPNDKDFQQKANSLSGSDLSASSAQLQGLTSNKDLAPAFGAAPECRRLSAPAAPH
ncbi:MAG: hypothetical protein ACRDQU_17275 [Pseudonocardiaceae bacterium]